MSPKPKQSRPTSAVRLRVLLRRPLISGLIILVPLGTTIFVLKFLYDFTAGRIAPLVTKVAGPIPDYAVPAVSVFLLFAAVYFIGMAANVFLGRKLIAFAEALIHRIPLVKSVYSASKQIVESVSFQEKGAEPRTAALIEFPRAGMKTVGFVTGKLQFSDGRIFYRVFIPTTPNITVGLFQLVAPEDVYKCELPVDEAVKMMISGGIIGPDRMRITRASQAPIEPPPRSDEDEDLEDGDGQ